MIHALLLAASFLAALQAREDPHRQFDFWIGEWSVLNRHMRPDGTWADGDTTRARVTPVCGDRAVLEQWAGPFRGRFMNGFSLRAWDPGEERWSLLLFWTADGNGGFSRLDGRFRHGRGEFFGPAVGKHLTRYTFSDALAGSVRWDSATSNDAGITWKTDWIMEFTRTRPAAEVTQERLFEQSWNAGRLSPYAEARALDWLVGTWQGTQVDGERPRREARLRCTLMAKDCLVVDLLETRTRAEEGWREQLSVRGYESRGRSWASWRVSESDPSLRLFRGARQGERMVFEREDPTTGRALREVLVRLGEDEVRIAEGRPGRPPTRTTTLKRVRR